MRYAVTWRSSGSSSRRASGTGRLRARIEDESTIPEPGRTVLGFVGQLDQLDQRIAQVGAEILAWHRANPVSQRLARIPGIGPLIASAIVATVPDPSVFRSGREFAAWLGLVPRQHSTGGKERLGRISRQGNRSIGNCSSSVPTRRCCDQRKSGQTPGSSACFGRRPALLR